MPVPSMELHLFGNRPFINVGGTNIQLKKNRYYEILCYLAYSGGSSNVDSIWEALCPGEGDALRNVRVNISNRLPKELCKVLNLPERRQGQTYIVLEGKVASLMADKCDLSKFRQLAMVAKETLNPTEAKKAVDHYLSMAGQTEFLECVEEEGWHWAWVDAARQELNLILGVAKDLAGYLSPPPQSTQIATVNPVPAYENASEETQELLHALSACAYECSALAARGISRIKSHPPTIFKTLIADGLVQRSLHDGRIRYSLNPDLAHYLRKEKSLAFFDRYRERHLKFFLHFTFPLARQLAEPNSSKALDELGLEYENICLAIDWALEKKRSDGLTFCYYLQNFWGAKPNLIRSLRFCEHIIKASPQTPTPDLARSYKTAGVLASYLYLYDKANAFYEKSEKIWRSVIVSSTEAQEDITIGILNAQNDRCLIEIDTAAKDPAFYAKAEATLRKIIKKREEIGGNAPSQDSYDKNERELATVFFNLGTLYYYQSEHENQMASYQRHGKVDARDHSDAKEYLRKSLQVLNSRSPLNKEGVANCNHFLGKCDLSEGELVSAFLLIRGSLDTFANEVKDTRSQIETLESFAYISAMKSKYELASRLLGVSHLQRGVAVLPMKLQERAEYEKYVMPVIRQIGQASFGELFFKHGFGSFPEALRFALSIDLFA